MIDTTEIFQSYLVRISDQDCAGPLHNIAR